MGQKHFLQKGKNFFGRGEFLGTELNGDAVTLAEGKDGKLLKEGIYVSPVIFTPDFKRLVLSWNCDTPGNSSIKIDGRIRMAKQPDYFVNHSAEKEPQDNSEPVWSEWLTWGKWGNNIKRCSGISEKESDAVKINVDTLEISSPDLIGDRFQFRVSFIAKDESPVFKLAAQNLLQLEKSIGMTDVSEMTDVTETTIFSECSTLGEPLHIILDVPAYSQMRRDPYIAKVMCSATCCSMVLNYYGFDILPEEAAWGLKDFDYGDANSGFGNWSFNTAYLGSQGFESYVKSISIKELKDEIKMGRPTPVSVAYSNKPDDGLPFIPGAPTRTSGHIILVCGFTYKEGIEYVVVNDPAAQVNQGVRRFYPVDQFLKAWSHSDYTAYIIKSNKENMFSKQNMLNKEKILKMANIHKNDKNSEVLELFANGKKIDILKDEIAVIMYKCKDCEYYEYIDIEIAKMGLCYESIQWKRKDGPIILINEFGKVITGVLKYSTRGEIV